MGKDWYIKLEVGKWQTDVDAISLEAEGALLKLTFKLREDFALGSLLIRLSNFARMIKKPPDEALKIAQELAENHVLAVEFLPENFLKFTSRRITREAAKSLTNSENGKKGGRGNKKEKRNESDLKAKSKQIHDYDYNYDNGNNSKKEKEVKEEKPSNQEAEKILIHLRDLSGRNRMDVKNPTSQKFIIARRKEGYTVEELMEIVELMVLKWKGDAKMEQYLRAETLFNRDKCAQYRLLVQEAKDKGLTAQQIKGAGGQYSKGPKGMDANTLAQAAMKHAKELLK